MMALSPEALERMSRDISRSVGCEVKVTASGASALESAAPGETVPVEESVETSTGVAAGGSMIGVVGMGVGLDTKRVSDAHELGIAFGPAALLVAGVALLGKWQRRKGRSR